MGAGGSTPGRSRRRSSRIPRRVSVVLRWRDLEGKSKEEPAETTNISRYGCMLACSTAHRLAEELIVHWPEGKRETRARIVWRETSSVQGRVQVGVEFFDVENFWGIDFPPDAPGWSPFRS